MFLQNCKIMRWGLFNVQNMPNLSVFFSTFLEIHLPKVLKKFDFAQILKEMNMWTKYNDRYIPWMMPLLSYALNGFCSNMHILTYTIVDNDFNSCKLGSIQVKDHLWNFGIPLILITMQIMCAINNIKDPLCYVNNKETYGRVWS